MPGNALGAFLRARREALGPAAAGLPTGPRRRTPGLRRGELASLAGISVEYLIRLERGRDRRPSPQVLAALADALQLSDDERVHLHRLVKAGDGGPCPQSHSTPRAVRRTVLALLDQLEPAPAFVIDQIGDVLACTEGFRKLADPVGLLDADNIPRYVFTDPRARHAFPEWEHVADEWAVRLRAAADLGDPRAADLAAELALIAGFEFGARYAASTRLPAWTGIEWWGELRLAFEALGMPGTDEHRLVVLVQA
ncbi:MAG: helix-turn-helix transcriptional regulator [Pseudonocardiaceae bacterium]